MEQINNKIEQMINSRSQHLKVAWSQHQAKLESAPSKTRVGTSEKKTHVFNNSQKLSYNNKKKCLNS